MKNTLAFFAFIASLLTLPLSALADGLYIGGAIGNSEYEKLGSVTTMDNLDPGSETSYTVRSGYKINKYAAFEFSYSDFGEIEGRRQTDSNEFGTMTRETFSSQSLGVAVIGIFPLTRKFSIDAKVGVELWEIDYEKKIIYPFNNLISPQDDPRNSSTTYDGDSVFYGIGATFKPSKSIEFTLNYDVHSWEFGNRELNNENISIGFNIAF